MNKFFTFILLFHFSTAHSQLPMSEMNALLNAEQEKGNKHINEVNKRVKTNIDSGYETFNTAMQARANSSYSRSSQATSSPSINNISLNSTSFTQGKYQHDIQIPPDVINNIDCKGSYDVLAPLIPAYTSRDLADLRATILTTTIASTLQEAKLYTNKHHSGNREQLLKAIKAQANEHDDSALSAAKTASQTWGGPGEDIVQRVYKRTLPLNHQCSETININAGAVCAVIANRMGSVTQRFSAEVIKKCWQP